MDLHISRLMDHLISRVMDLHISRLMDHLISRVMDRLISHNIMELQFPNKAGEELDLLELDLLEQVSPDLLDQDITVTEDMVSKESDLTTLTWALNSCKDSSSALSCNNSNSLNCNSSSLLRVSLHKDNFLRALALR